jgi:putative YhdH/YhfP family quinone oxidoreductase
MTAQTFKAMVVTETPEKTFQRGIQERAIDQLPEGAVLVRVHYSSLNYKDALSATGNKGVTRRYPHTPGIDAAGVVAASSSPDFSPGDEVIVTSYDLGMNTAGGFGGYIRVPAEWVVKRPSGLSLRESMIYGTAGFTAGLAILKLTAAGLSPTAGEVLVTGATGGVGSLAVAILAHLGFNVVGVSGKPQGADFLARLGAKETISREAAIDSSGRPLLRGRWAGVVDTVGGEMLATALKSTDLNGTLTCCGNVGGPALNTTVFPFILRGVGLLGIDSQNCPMNQRQQVWRELAAAWRPEALASLADEVDLEGLDPKIDQILAGGLTGRVVVNLNP